MNQPCVSLVHDYSVLIATRNRASMLPGCLDAVWGAISKHQASAEIIVIDNGSTDDTPACVHAWSQRSGVEVRLVFEPKPGLSRAQNAGMRVAQGRVFVFTDDDCRVASDYFTAIEQALLRYGPTVVLGGRVELGDPLDLPVTICTEPDVIAWQRGRLPLRGRRSPAGIINGCNLVVPRAVMADVGPFDENFGSGAFINSGGDTDFLYRAYCKGILLCYAPSMIVGHFHGRRDRSGVKKLVASYTAANGALYLRYLFSCPEISLGFIRYLKNWGKEIVRGGNYCWPEMGITSRDAIRYLVRGMFRYMGLRMRRLAN